VILPGPVAGIEAKDINPGVEHASQIRRLVGGWS
jgi:hypothetical protein